MRYFVLAAAACGLWALQMILRAVGRPERGARIALRWGVPTVALLLLAFWIFDPTRPVPANNELLTDQAAFLTFNAVTGLVAWASLILLERILDAIHYVASNIAKRRPRSGQPDCLDLRSRK